jgi:hypothetical protein
MHDTKHLNKKMEDKILEIIKEESENANVRKYTCVNGFGYSQFERNIADRVVKLFCQPVVSGSSVVNRCNECSKELEGGTVFCSVDCRQHYYR